MTRLDVFASVLLAVVAVSEIRARLRARKIGVGGRGLDGRRGTAPTPMFHPSPGSGGPTVSPPEPSRFDHDYDTDDERWLWFLPPRDTA